MRCSKGQTKPQLICASGNCRSGQKVPSYWYLITPSGNHPLNQFFFHSLWLFCFGLLTLHGPSCLAQETINGKFSAGMGYLFGREEAKTTAIFEPGVIAEITPNHHLETFALIFRPTEPTDRFEIPWVRVRYWHTFPSSEEWRWRGLGQVAALALHEWNSVGPSLRSSLGAELSRAIFKNSRLGLRVTPFWQWNRYRTDAEGNPRNVFGASQILWWEWSPQNWTLEVQCSLSQSWAGIWQQEYAIREELNYHITPGAILSLSHEFSTNFIDGSTGRRRSFRFFDSLGSQLSLLVRLDI